MSEPNTVRLLFDLPLEVIEHIALNQHRRVMRGGGTNWKHPRPATVKKITRDFVRHILTTYDECRYAEPTRIEEFKKQTDAILVAHYPMLATQAAMAGAEHADAASSPPPASPLAAAHVDDGEPTFADLVQS